MNLTTKQMATAAAALVVVAAIAAWHWWFAAAFVHGRTIIGPAELKSLDPGNAGINIVVTQPWFNDSVLVFNVDAPSKTRDFDRRDVTRCLLQCAKSLEDRNFKRLYLANKWNRMYYLDETAVKSLGQRYRNGDTWNNAALYLEVPRRARTLNDSLAFNPDDGVLRALSDMSNWNTMMGHLVRR